MGETVSPFATTISGANTSVIFVAVPCRRGGGWKVSAVLSAKDPTAGVAMTLRVG